MTIPGQFNISDTKQLSKMCSLYAKKFNFPAITNPVCIDVTWVEKVRNRPIQIVAEGIDTIITALQDSCVIAGNSWYQIYGIVHHFKTDNNEPRIVVEISDD